MVFDLSNKVTLYSLVVKESFTNVVSWINEIEKHAGDSVTILVLGNKADSPLEEIEVTDADIQKFEE